MAPRSQLFVAAAASTVTAAAAVAAMVVHRRITANSAAASQTDVTGRQSKFVVILGAQWGDEGKGKLVDILAGGVDLCVRFNGGANAGHTLIVDGAKYAFHLLPCGIVRKDCINLIGNGVVAHVPTLLHELEQLEQFDPRAIERLRISSRAHVLLDLFQDIDGMLEAEKRGNAIGTTKRGIGPCYAAKATRNGIRFHDLLDVEVLEEKLKALIEFNKLHYPSIKVDLGEEMAKLAAITAKIRHCIVDSVSYIHESIARGDSILAEGANAALLDLDFGTYPFVTSSSTTVGGVCTGLGVNMKQVGCVVGVVKAYTTRVGHGPFPTELDDADGQRLGDNGHEYGTTTGRKRRCGWLDVPLVRYGAKLNGYDSMNITKLDVLTGFEKIKVAVRYVLEGKTLPDGYMPASLTELARVECEYETFAGWEEDISHCTAFDQLPANARAYVRGMERLCGMPASWIGVGPDRSDMFVMPGL